MIYKKNESKSDKKGYSIIELVVIITIISILALIAFPRYSNFKKNSEINADLSTCKVIYDTIHILMAKDIPVNDVSIGNMIDRGYPIPQASDGVAFTYTLSPVVVKTSTPGVQHPQN